MFGGSRVWSSEDMAACLSPYAGQRGRAAQSASWLPMVDGMNVKVLKVWKGKINSSREYLENCFFECLVWRIERKNTLKL